MSDSKSTDEAGKTTDGGKGGDEQTTFTQEDVDRIVQERLARAKPKKPADYEDLKAKAARLDEIEAENQSETEKAVRKAREEAEAEVTARFQKERVLDKIEVAAAGQFHDVEDARLHLGARAEEFLDDDGAVDTDAIADAVKALLDEKPHLRKQEERRGASRREVGLGSKGNQGGKDRRKVTPGLGRLEIAYADGNDD